MKECIDDIFKFVGQTDFYRDLKMCKDQCYGWKAAALRARKASLELERHLKRFRALSCAEEQKSRNQCGN